MYEEVLAGAGVILLFFIGLGVCHWLAEPEDD
jgi:hypothetical protein